MKTEQEIRMILSACMSTHGIDTKEGVNGIVYAKDCGHIYNVITGKDCPNQ